MAPKSDKDSSAKTGKKRTVTPWGVGRTLTWLFVLVAVAVAIVSLLRSRDGDKKFEPKQGVPTEASAKQLREFASPQRPVYWAGPASSGRLELTTTAKAVYVRYLPKGVRTGDRAPNYLTIATYSVPNANASLRRSAKAAGAAHASAPRGGIAVWRISRPTSVYLAYPGVRYLIEVYDPHARLARSIALGGKVKRVS